MVENSPERVEEAAGTDDLDSWEEKLQPVVVREIECKSVLNKSGIPGIDYALNPYLGCEHRCQYCYADFMKRFTRHTEPWGAFVDVKVNAPEILAGQLRRLKPGVISLGTVTDGYQPVEREYRISRRCLEELTTYEFPVSILTKSSLVLRDADLLTRLKHTEVGFSMTCLNEPIRKVFEPYSSSVWDRLRAIRDLSHKGIKTWIFFSPVLPYFADSEEEIDRLFSLAADAGVDYLLVDTLNLYPKVWSRMRALVSSHFPEALSAYNWYHRNKLPYQDELRGRIAAVGTKYRLRYEFAF